MSFGEFFLKKFGWEEGKGLGLTESGITSAIKPKLKFDTSGFGCNKSEEFTSHWWDHIYNKSAKAISIDKNEEGEIHISKTEKVKISTKISCKENVEKDIRYGNFVKGSILQGSNEIPENATADDTEQNAERSQELIKLFSNDELFRLCGGLTAHKGARHGITMSAKLTRLQQQESAFMSSQITNFNENTPNIERSGAKKTKKRKRKMKEEAIPVNSEAIDAHITIDTDVRLPEANSGKEKKRKNRSSEVRVLDGDSGGSCAISMRSDETCFPPDCGSDTEIRHKKKRRKKHKHNK